MNNSAEPVYFTITLRNGRESPAIYRDYLPTALSGKHAKANGLVYVVRLDTLHQPEFWLSMSASDLYKIYLKLKEQRKLPVSTSPPIIQDLY